jgi:hypothetical protein
MSYPKASSKSATTAFWRPATPKSNSKKPDPSSYRWNPQMKIIRQTADPRKKSEPPPQPGRISCFNSPAGILEPVPTAKKDSSSESPSLLLSPQALYPLLKRLTWIPHDLSSLPEKTIRKSLSQRPPGKPCPQLCIRDPFPSPQLKGTDPINQPLDNTSLATPEQPQKAIEKLPRENPRPIESP